MENHMLTDSGRHPAALERLSALVDGELDEGTAGQACADWRDDAESRSAWHAYHLIGDVLRADDLACDPVRDAALVHALRARLANEPVVLAPRPIESATPGALRAARQRVGSPKGARWSWRVPSAVAAGFVAVAGVLMLTRAPGTLPDRQTGTTLAQVASAASVTGEASMPTASALANSMSGEPQTLVASGTLIRDARLDRYLDAHKQFAGSSALGVPSVFLRSATTVSTPDR